MVYRPLVAPWSVGIPVWNPFFAARAICAHAHPLEEKAFRRLCHHFSHSNAPLPSDATFFSRPIAICWNARSTAFICPSIIYDPSGLRNMLRELVSPVHETPDCKIYISTHCLPSHFVPARIPRPPRWHDDQVKLVKNVEWKSMRMP